MLFAALRYDTGMPQRPFLAFACAHLADERLYAAQVAALEADSTIEQPESVNRVLIDWLRKTETHSLAMRAR
jgi:hypothetical protein